MAQCPVLDVCRIIVDYVDPRAPPTTVLPLQLTAIGRARGLHFYSWRAQYKEGDDNDPAQVSLLTLDVPVVHLMLGDECLFPLSFQQWSRPRLGEQYILGSWHCPESPHVCVRLSFCSKTKRLVPNRCRLELPAKLSAFLKWSIEVAGWSRFRHWIDDCRTRLFGHDTY